MISRRSFGTAAALVAIYLVHTRTVDVERSVLEAVDGWSVIHVGVGVAREKRE